MTYQAILERQGLRVTQSRLLVLEALSTIGKPASQKDLFEHIRKESAQINLVTVYRMLETFVERDIAHKHPSSGGYTLCSLQEQHGHHVLLSCGKCGTVQEHIDAELCKHENRIAKNAGFKPKHHVSEIIGLCPSCT